MKKNYKYFILAICVLISITTLNVDAAVGYTYSHQGEPIYSSVGFSATNDGVYTIISDSWKDPEGKAFPGNYFTDPEDLFVYTEKDGKDIIYIVDSKSNSLFIFDENLNFQKRITQFEIRPEKFTEQDILNVKVGKMVDEANNGGIKSTTSTSFTEYLTDEKKGITLDEFFAAGEMSYSQRVKEGLVFHITGNGLSGVYRSVRPARDERGIIIKDKFEDVIYLSDTNNNQIIIIDADTYEVVQIITSPTDASFAGKVFNPTKLVTDGPGLLFVISDGVFEGIMQMSYDGRFSSYLGVNYVSLSFWARLQRRFMTDEQLSSQKATLNTTFTSIAMDKEEFIYTTSNAIDSIDDSTMIKRINPSGKDVLTRNGYDVPKGDLIYVRTGPDATLRGPSRFTSITVNDFGVYTVADGKSGRLFTYDDEGNLLYISAGKGNELTDIQNPVAVRYQGEDVLVLDKGRKSVLRFEPTDIARSINKATKLHYEGHLDAASEEWKNVRNLNPNYEYAYIGIGKTLLNEGKYKDAMEHFQRGYSVHYYSRAYKLSRDETIQKYFTPVISTVLVLLAGWYAYKIYNKIRRKKLNPKKEDEAND